MADDNRQRDAWGSADFEQLAQRYWGAWGEAMRSAAPGGGSQAGVQAGVQAWHDAIDWWTRQAYGNRTGVNEALERFNSQAHGWFGQMQQVAARFAGRDNSARDIAQAWKQALGASGENPFPEMFRSMRGQGLQGLDQWIEDASPYLQAWRKESASWLGVPAFGFAREHQERLQKLAQAQLEYQEANSAYNALMLKASQSAIEIFEDKLIEHEEPGRQIESPRALFDLWIDAAEEAYAQIALSPEFRAVYGRLVDAQMRVRAGIQREVEEVCAKFDMPTRTELDGAHRKIVELERAVRRLRDAGVAAQGNTPAGEGPPPAGVKTRKTAAGRNGETARRSATAKTTKRTASKDAGKRAGSSRKAAAKPPRKKAARTVREAAGTPGGRSRASLFDTSAMPVAPDVISKTDPPDAPGGGEGR